MIFFGQVFLVVTRRFETHHHWILGGRAVPIWRSVGQPPEENLGNNSQAG